MRVNIGQKLTLSFLLVALLVGVLGFVGYSGMKDAADHVEVMADREVPAVLELAEMKSYVLEGVHEALAYPLLGDPLEKAEFYHKLEQFDASAIAFEEIDLTERTGQPEEEVELFSQLITAKESLLLAADTMFEIYEKDGNVGLTELAAFEDAAHSVIPIIDQLLAVAEQEVDEAHEDVHATFASTERLTLFVVVIAILLAVGLGVLVSRSISVPINRLRDAAQRVGRGETDTPIDIKSKDEIGDLGLSFSKMTRDLKNTTVSRDYVDNIIQSMIDALIVIDPDGTIRTVNWTTQEVSGYAEDELIGKPVSLLIEEEKAFKDTGLHKLETGVPIRDLALTLRTMSGERIPVSFAESAMRDSAGELTGIVGIARDLRESKRLQEVTLLAANLERSNKSLEEFANVASHDLQEPLRKVRAFGDLLRSESAHALNDESREYLDHMQDAAERMQGLISDLLSLSRITTKGQASVSVDLNKVTRQVLEDLEIRIEESGGEIDLGELPTIEADPTQMHQLMQNLVGNALKFHKDGDSPAVKIRGRHLNGANGHSPGESELHDLCEITVEDNGIGFDEIYTDRIFTVFQRLHGRGSYEGTGIGLAICRRIVERHGGSITASSAPDSGSTFAVTLPIQQNREEATP